MVQPSPSAGQMPEPVRPGPPPSVVMAVRLMYAGAVVSALSLIVGLLTVGSLRSPGQYGSGIAFRWRDVRPGADAGPWLATGDDSIPRRRLEDTQYSRKEVR